jgi:hypothetical protein
MNVHRFVLYLPASAIVSALSAAPAPSAAEAEQLRVIQAMTAELRARIDRLPVLIAADTPLGRIEERIVTLNRDPVTIEGQRFDGIVVVAPRDPASFAWTFAAPANCASWYIAREKGDMKGFANYLRRPRAQVPLAAGMKPAAGAELTFQTLDRTAWSAGERHILWFRFKDATPAEFTVRAGFFARPSLNNNALPALLFPPAPPAKSDEPRAPKNP